MQKENIIGPIIVKKECHSRGMLSGIFLIPSRCSGLIQANTLCYNNRNAGDPRQKPSGMTALFNNSGFTLIELLVVVLIIGILAAVAVPQYKKAVIKSRVGTIIPVLASMTKAMESHYLANGSYTNDGRILDIETGCTEVADTEGIWWKCGNDFLVNFSANGVVAASYCPGDNTSYEVCKPVRQFQIGFGAPHSMDAYVLSNTRRCWAPSNSTKASEEICKTLGTPLDCNKPNSLCYELY